MDCVADYIAEDRMSRYLFRDLERIELQLRAGTGVLLFCDFDGTLAPIVEDRDKALMPAETRSALLALASRHDVKLAIISGRALADIVQRVGIRDVVYAGNHGLEISGGSLSFQEPIACRLRPLMHAVAEELASSLGPITGASVEDKGLTISVHYRRVEEAAHTEVHRRVRDVLAAVGDRVRLASGRRVLEIRPPTDWHKGAAVSFIRDQIGWPDPVAVYIGDDRTDEDAFSALPDGITVRVGEPQPTAAAYHLRDPHEVEQLLLWMNDCLEQRESKKR